MPHNNLHRILLIAKRDYLATIRTKAFIIGLVVAPILFGGGFLGVALIAKANRISRSGASPSWTDRRGRRRRHPGGPGPERERPVR
jgi:hypothetical protein